MQERDHQDKTIEEVSLRNISEHGAEEVTVHSCSRQAGNDGSKDVTGEPHGKVAAQFVQASILHGGHVEVGDKREQHHQLENQSHDKEDIPVELTGENDEATNRDHNEEQGGHHDI